MWTACFVFSSTHTRATDTERIVSAGGAGGSDVTGSSMLAIRQEASSLQLRPFAERPARASIGAKRNPESTRAILDAAEAILKEKGLAGLSMDEVARRAQCGKPTLYRWWPTKAALLAEIHGRTLGQTSQRGMASCEECARHWIQTWEATLAGPALRGMLAEAQSSDAAARVLIEQGLEPYRHDVASVPGIESQDIELILTQTLVPLLGELMLGTLSISSITLKPSATRERRPVMRVVQESVRAAEAMSPRVEESEIRHRGEWID